MHMNYFLHFQLFCVVQFPKYDKNFRVYLKSWLLFKITSKLDGFKIHSNFLLWKKLYHWSYFSLSSDLFVVSCWLYFLHCICKSGFKNFHVSLTPRSYLFWWKSVKRNSIFTYTERFIFSAPHPTFYFINHSCGLQ